MRHGKKPTIAQNILSGLDGLAPEKWLVVKMKKNGEMVILHKTRNIIRVIPA